MTLRSSGLTPRRRRRHRQQWRRLLPPPSNEPALRRRRRIAPRTQASMASNRSSTTITTPSITHFRKYPPNPQISRRAFSCKRFVCECSTRNSRTLSTRCWRLSKNSSTSSLQCPICLQQSQQMPLQRSPNRCSQFSQCSYFHQFIRPSFSKQQHPTVFFNTTPHPRHSGSTSRCGPVLLSCSMGTVCFFSRPSTGKAM